MNEPDQHAYHIVLGIYIIIFALVFVICLLVEIDSLVKRDHWNVVKALKCLLPWPIFCKILS